MKNILIDTSSAILLFKAEVIEFLLSAYQVMITPSVYDEMKMDGYPGADTFRRYCARQHIRVVREKVEAPIGSKSLSKLDIGERDIIRMYLGGTGDFIIIDDGRGAGFCRDEKIPYINALLVPRILYESNKISRHLFRKTTDRIIDLGRYTPKIINYAQNCPKKDLEYFLP